MSYHLEEKDIKTSITATRNPLGMATVSIDKYEIPWEWLPMEESEKKTFSAAEADGRHLIAYWSVDYQRKGEVHRSDYVSSGWCEGEEGEISIMIPKEATELRVMIVDVLGNSVTRYVSVN